MRHVMGLSLIISLGLLSSPARSQPLRVESAALSVAVDPARGDLVALEDRAERFNYLAEEASPLFLLQFTRADRSSFWRDSRAAEAMSVQAATDTLLALRYTGIEVNIDAEVRVTASPDSRQLLFRLDIDNRSPLILETVIFPLLRLKLPLGESADDDRVFIPGGDGLVLTSEGLERNRHTYRRYPGPASMQFLAYYDDDQGLSLICQDTEAGVKDFGYSIEEGALRLAVFQRRPFIAGQGYSSPWFALQPCAGSWTEAAQAYREWARGQWWAQPKAPERATPEWLRRSPLVLGGDFRPLGNGRMYPPLDRWPELAAIWQEETGAGSAMVEWRNWERFGYYTSPSYFPLYPSPERVRRTLASLHRIGVHSQAMVAGLKWMIRRESYHTPHYNVTAFDGEARFEREGREVCIVGRDGELDVRKAYFTWDGDHAFICPATGFAGRHFERTARVLAQAGFDLFEFDQMNGGCCPTCYSAEHGHPPGDGSWMHREIAALMERTRREGRRHNPDFGLSLEDPTELLLPYLDTYISRANDLINWPAAGPGSQVVPAFMYVYHPLLPATTLDVQLTTRRDDLLLLRLARAFTYGAGLSAYLTPWQLLADYGEEDLLPLPWKMDPAQRELLQALVRTREGPGRPYLQEGEMLASPPLEAPPVSLSTTYHTGTQSEAASITVPAVIHSGWMLPDGRVAFFFVNVTREGVRFSFAPRAQGRPLLPGVEATVYRNDRPSGTVPLSEQMTLAAPGLSVVMVEFTPAFVSRRGRSAQ